MSVSIENFVKAVYQINEDNRERVTTTNLANKLAITNAAITDMAKNLSKKGLIDYKKYKEIKLTPSGEKKAIGIIRRHRLWELFLHKVLGMSWDEVHEEAEALEHQTSENLMNRIDEFLEFPKFDPHGDPIPDKNGNIPVRENEILLAEAENGNYTIVRLSAVNENFISFIKENNLVIGQRIRVDSKLAESGMVTVSHSNVRLVLNKDLSSIISVIKD